MIEITLDEYNDHLENNNGICLSCGEFTCGGCEPDARRYHCDECGKDDVYGLEEAILMGDIFVV
jgi:hypothetical protein